MYLLAFPFASQNNDTNRRNEIIDVGWNEDKTFQIKRNRQEMLKKKKKIDLVLENQMILRPKINSHSSSRQ